MICIYIAAVQLLSGHWSNIEMYYLVPHTALCCTVLRGKIIPVVVGPERALQQCRQRDLNCHESHQMIHHCQSRAYSSTDIHHVLHTKLPNCT